MVINMFNRFRDSLVYPSRIIQFRNDSFWRIFSYIVVFGIVMSAGAVVFVVNFTGVNRQVQQVFQDELKNTQINCQIEDAQMTCTSAILKNFYDDGYIMIFVDSSDEVDFGNYQIMKNNFIFHEDKLIIYNFGLELEYNLTDLPQEFQNINFNDIMNDKEAFSENIINGVSAYLYETKSIWSIFVVGIEFLSNILFMMFIVLINSWVLKSRFKIIPYKEVFKMSVYSATGLYVLLTFNGLINLGFTLLLLFIILTVWHTNALSMAIYKVINKK
jgi:hypothetical protein